MDTTEQAGHVTSFELNLLGELRDPKFRHAFFQGEARHEIARQIRSLRLKRGMTQVGFARSSHMPQSAVSRIEQADYSGWTFKTLCRVAEALDARLRIVIEPSEAVLGEYKSSDRGRDHDAVTDALGDALRHLHTANNGSETIEQTALPYRSGPVHGLLGGTPKIESLWNFDK
jgi:transcriptional regulator with XRE-family HTH domain